MNNQDNSQIKTHKCLEPTPPPLVLQDQDQPNQPQTTLLPPDHPLLANFQKTLKDYLLRAKAKLVIEISDLQTTVDDTEKKRIDNGCKLHDWHLITSRQEAQLKECAREIKRYAKKRLEQDEAIAIQKVENELKRKKMKDCQMLYNKRLAELEQFQIFHSRMQSWYNETEVEMKNVQRVVSRDIQIQKEKSEKKKKSDLLLLHLETEIKKCEKRLAIMKEEEGDMLFCIDVLEVSQADSIADLECIQSEQKRLTQNWNEVIMAISQREKLLCQLKNDIEKENKSIIVSNSEIAAIKKQTMKENKQSRMLEGFHIRITEEFNRIKGVCQSQSDILNDLERKIEDLPLLLEKTEISLKEAKKEGSHVANEIRSLEIKIEHRNIKKAKLEESLFELTAVELITNKASQYRHKVWNNLLTQRRVLEKTVVETQKRYAETLARIGELKVTNYRLQDNNEKLRAQLNVEDAKLTKLEKELLTLDNNITQKMNVMEKLTKKLGELLIEQEERGGVSEKKAKIQALEKAKQLAQRQVNDQQQFWLLIQNHYVKLTKKRTAQLCEFRITQKRMSIVKQKTLKVDNDICKVVEQGIVLEREIKLYETKLELLTTKSMKKRLAHEAEETSCEMEHLDLIDKLKVNEMQVLKLEENLNDLQNDIEQLNDLVLEKHREALSWETKYKLIDDTLRLHKQDLAKDGELKNIRIEVKQLHIRYDQLKRAEEKLKKDLEKCIENLEAIENAKNMKREMEKRPNYSIRSAVNIERKKHVLQTKTDKLNADIKHQNTVVKVEKIHQHGYLKDAIDNMHKTRANLNEKNDQLLLEIKKTILLKQFNFEEIVTKQNYAKLYKRLGDTSQELPKTRTKEYLDEGMQKQLKINNALSDMAKIMFDKFPHLRPVWLGMLQTLKHSRYLSLCQE